MKNVDDIKEYINYLNEYFENEYILIGGIFDMVEIGTSIPKDIDVLITKRKFEYVFGKNKKYIHHENLKINIAKFRSLFKQLLYRGYYSKNIKTDIFILDHFTNHEEQCFINNPNLLNIDNVTARFCTIKHRIDYLNYLLELSYNSDGLSHWTQDWLKHKQSTVSNKLNLYYQKYPEFKLN